MNSPERSEKQREDFPEKVLALHQILEERDIPYAIGGAVALAYCSRARATVDIDIGIFLPPEEKERVADALNEVFPIPNREDFLREVDRNQQGYTAWGSTKIDVFFSTVALHESMARRARMVSFGGAEIRVLSPEDLVVCKASFDRSKDWFDIENICKYMGSELDIDYIDSWLSGSFGEDDPRVSRMAELIEHYSIG